MPAKAAPAKAAAAKPKAAAAAPAAKAAAPAAKAAAPAPAAKAAKAAAPSGNGVYVKGWGNGSVADATAAFAAAGAVASCTIRRKKFALVHFETAAAAKKAIDTFNGKEVCGATVAVSAAKSGPKPDKHEGTSVVFVSPVFAENTTRKSVMNFFADCGKVVKLRTYHNNTAFVYFADAAAAAKAVKDKNGADFHQKKLTVRPSIRSLAADKKKFEHSKAIIEVNAWKHRQQQ